MIDKPERIALIDLDGTVADYDRAMRREMLRLQSPGEPEYTERLVTGDDEVPYMEARRKLIQAKAGFWSSLPLIQAGFEVVGLLREVGFGLHVLTKGPRSTPTAWTEKLQWSHEHLPDALVTVTSDKSGMYGRVLVDDFPPYFTKWLDVRARGLVICVAQPWNRDYAPGGAKEHPRVVRWDGWSVDGGAEMRRVIQRAYSRPAGEAF